jgi:hypothetical protein
MTNITTNVRDLLKLLRTILRHEAAILWAQQRQEEKVQFINAGVKLTEVQLQTLQKMFGFGWQFYGVARSIDTDEQAAVCKSPAGFYGIVYPNDPRPDQQKRAIFWRSDWQYVSASGQHQIEHKVIKPAVDQFAASPFIKPTGVWE